MKILLVQTAFLGDVILSTPLVAALHERFPGAEVTLLTTPVAAELVRRDPLLAGVLTFDKRGAERGIGGLRRAAAKLRAERFDRAYSVHRSWRTSLLLFLARIPERIGFAQSKFALLYTRTVPRRQGVHDVLRNLSLLADPGKPWPAMSQELRLFAPPESELSPAVREFLKSARPYAVFAPGSVWTTKRWHAEGFRAVVAHVAGRGMRAVLVGSESERSVCEEVSGGNAENFAGVAGLGDLCALVSRARLVVCNDSMALHVASAFKAPTVAVFCATSPSFGFGPWKNRAEIVEASGLTCKPCSRHGGPRCPLNTEACMRVPARQAIEAADRLLRDCEAAA